MRFLAGLWRLAIAALGVTALKAAWPIPWAWTYFDVQVTILGTFVLLWAGAASLIHGMQPPAWLKGATATYAIVVLIASFTVMPGAALNAPTGIPGLTVPVVIHWIMPAMMVIDFVVFDPHRRLKALDVLAWLAYPVLYVLFLLARGTWWHGRGPGEGGSAYPLRFLDPTLLGWPQFGVSCLKALAALLVVGVVVCVLDRALPARSLTARE